MEAEYRNIVTKKTISVPTIIMERKSIIKLVPEIVNIIRNVYSTKIISIQVGKKPISVTRVRTYTLTDVEIADILRLFEGHFSGTDYMYILQNWIVMNPQGDFGDFIDTFCNDRKLIYVLKDIIKETYDVGQYHIAQTILHYMTRMKAKVTVYGNISTYSDYLKDTSPTLYTYYNNILSNTSDDNWSQVFSDEITYVLNLIKKLISDLGDESYVDTFGFLDDIRDTQINEVKNVLAYLVSYFTSMTMTIKDPEFKYELGDEEDVIVAREGLSVSSRSDRFLNKFDLYTDTLSIYKKKSISETFEIKDYVSIKYNKFKEKIIGG